MNGLSFGRELKNQVIKKKKFKVSLKIYTKVKVGLILH